MLNVIAGQLDDLENEVEHGHDDEPAAYAEQSGQDSAKAPVPMYKSQAVTISSGPPGLARALQTRFPGAAPKGGERKIWSPCLRPRPPIVKRPKALQVIGIASLRALARGAQHGEDAEKNGEDDDERHELGVHKARGDASQKIMIVAGM